MSNVIKFPKSPDNLPATQEDAQATIRTVRAEYIAEVIETVMERVGTDLISFGFNLSDKREHQKDWYWLQESMESLLYRYAKIPHDMQGLVDDAIRFPDEKEEEKPKRSRKKKDPPKDADV